MSTEFNPVHLELLRIARDLVINEYVDKRAEIHNQWLVESDHLWRTQRLRVAYPTIPPYPTEKDIVERAQLMLDFVKQQEELNPEPGPMPIPPPPEVEPVPETPVELPIISEPKQEIVEEAVIIKEEIVEDTKENFPDDEKLSGRILPSVLKKIDEFRKDWRKS